MEGLTENFQSPLLLSPLCNCALQADVVVQQFTILHVALQMFHKVGGKPIFGALELF